MKHLILAGIGLSLLVGAAILLRTANAEKTTPRVLRHVVLFKFKPEATPEQITKIEQAFAQLPSRIDSIQDFEWGVNNSPEGHDKGLTHCFLVTFRDEAGRDQYLPHPAHQEFVTQLKPILADVTVVDYWAGR